MIVRSKFTDQREGWLVWLEKLRKVHGVSLSTKNPHPLCCQACSHTLSTTSCYHSATFNHQAILVTNNCSPESINKPSLSTTITLIQTHKSCNSSTSRKIISQVFEFFNLQTFEQLYSLFKIEEFKDLRFFARGWRIVGFDLGVWLRGRERCFCKRLKNCRIWGFDCSYMRVRKRDALQEVEELLDLRFRL